MSKHSPGPWKWHYDDFCGGHYALVSQSGEIVLDDGSADGEYSARIDPDSPDGRLVESAPEILDALIDCMSALRLAGGESHPAMDKARAVVAKATGEVK